MDQVPKGGVGKNPKIMLIAAPKMLLLTRIRTTPTIMSKPHKMDVSDIETKTVPTWSDSSCCIGVSSTGGRR